MVLCGPAEGGSDRRAEGTVPSERTDRKDRTDRADLHDRPDRPDRQEPRNQRHDRYDRPERPERSEGRSLAEWTRSVMSARPPRVLRPRRAWHLDAPPRPPADDDPAADLSWFGSSLALAQGLRVIEHAEPPDAAALDAAAAAAADGVAPGPRLWPVAASAEAGQTPPQALEDSGSSLAQPPAG